MWLRELVLLGAWRETAVRDIASMLGDQTVGAVLFCSKQQGRGGESVHVVQGINEKTSNVRLC